MTELELLIYLASVLIASILGYIAGRGARERGVEE